MKPYKSPKLTEIDSPDSDKCGHPRPGMGGSCGKEKGHDGPHSYFCCVPGCPGFSIPASYMRHPCKERIGRKKR